MDLKFKTRKYFKIKWKPLNVIIDNVINLFM